MPSTDSDTDVDPETEAAIRQVMSEELRGVVRAIAQLGGGLLVGLVGLSALTGGLIAADAPPALFGLVGIGFLLLVAYGWRLPPFR
ncbi:MAG: hypothetical protein J07HN4v3_02888 [Halonotius sp. J07HN4]|nr:MAG: hypothetical protein J07HN4v3_02888 [Halonotius sp. J07HN4]